MTSSRRGEVMTLENSRPSREFTPKEITRRHRVELAPMKLRALATRRLAKTLALLMRHPSTIVFSGIDALLVDTENNRISLSGCSRITSDSSFRCFG